MNILNEIEQERYEKFRQKHYDKCKSSNFTLKIVYTGIGPAYYVKCDFCKKKKEITDYKSW